MNRALYRDFFPTHADFFYKNAKDLFIFTLEENIVLNK